MINIIFVRFEIVQVFFGKQNDKRLKSSFKKLNSV